jgi:hypothetical protein
LRFLPQGCAESGFQHLVMFEDLPQGVRATSSHKELGSKDNLRRDKPIVHGRRIAGVL